MTFRYLGVGFLVLVWCGLASAAQINLVNGKQLTGRIVSEDAETLQVEVGGVTVSFFKSEVVSIVDDQGEIRVIEEPSPTPTLVPIPVDTPATIELPPEETAPVIQDSPETQSEPEEQEEPVMTATPIPQATPTATPSPRPTIPPTPAPLQKVDEVSPLLPVILPKGRTHVIEAGMLNVRRGPSTDFDKLTAAPKDTIVIERERQGGWVQIQLPDGLLGWVNERFLTALKDEPVITQGERVNYRRGPSLNADILRKLGEEEVLLLLRQQGNWVQLRDAEDVVGWASGQYIARITQPASLQPRYQMLGGAGEGIVEERVPIAGSDAVTVRLTLDNDLWVSGGKISLVLLAPDREQKDWYTLIQGRDIVHKTASFGSDAGEKIGLDETIAGNAEASQRIFIKGFLKDQSWVFEYRLAQTTPPGLRRLLIGQRGDLRGKVWEF